jgi:hypothetical protein
MMRRPAFIARQAGRPAGFVGRLLLGVMSRETARFNGDVSGLVHPVVERALRAKGHG